VLHEMTPCYCQSRHFLFSAAFLATSVGETLHCSKLSEASDEGCFATAFLQDRAKLSFELREATQTTALHGKDQPFSLKPFLENRDGSLEHRARTQVMTLLQPMNLCLAFSLVSMAIGVHELFVVTGSQPLLARNAAADSHMLKVFFACVWFSSFVSASMPIPISYDLAISMGQGPMASGLFLSGGMLAGGLAILLGGQLAQDKDWDQTFARMICITAPMTLAAVHMVEACVIQSSTSESRNASWWYLLLLRQVEGFFASILIQPVSTMLARAAQPSHRTLSSHLGRHIGLMAGPLMFAAQSLQLKRCHPQYIALPRSNAAWTFVILAGQALLLALLASFAVPKTLPSLSQVRSPSLSSSRRPTSGVDVLADKLSPPDQERLLFSLIVFTVESAFTVTAVEVASIMLLEVVYHWRVEHTSYFLFGVAALGCVLSRLVMPALTLKATEPFVFLASSLVGVVGCVFTFDFKLFGPLALFVANGLVCSSALIAGGVADSWASRASESESDTSKQRYRLISVACMSGSRFLSAPTARLLLSLGGRTWFAGVQTIIAILGFFRVLSACRIVWMKSELKKADTQAEFAPEDDSEGRLTDRETQDTSPEESLDRRSESESESLDRRSETSLR